MKEAQEGLTAQQKKRYLIAHNSLNYLSVAPVGSLTLSTVGFILNALYVIGGRMGLG